MKTATKVLCFVAISMSPHLAFADGLIFFGSASGSVGDIKKPQSIAVSPDGENVYVASFGKAAVVVFRRQPDGKLVRISSVLREDAGIVSANGANTLIVAPDGKHVYVAGARYGSIGTFSRAETGVLDLESLLASDIYYSGPGVGIGLLRRVNKLAMDSEGRNLYASSERDSAVAAYTRDSVTGALTPSGPKIEGIEKAAGLAVTPGGQYLYVAAYGENAIARLDRHPTTGALSGLQKIFGITRPRAVVVSPDGQHLYVVSKNSAVAAYSITSGGALNGPIDIEQDLTTGDCGVTVDLRRPESAVISPDGTRLYVAATSSRSIAVFERDPTTGYLAYRGRKKFGDFDCYSRVEVTAPKKPLALATTGSHVYAVGSSDRAVAEFAFSDGPLIDPDEEYFPQNFFASNSYIVNTAQWFPVRCGIQPYGQPEATDLLGNPAQGTIGPVEYEPLLFSSGFNYNPTQTGIQAVSVTDNCGRKAQYSFRVSALGSPTPAPTSAPTPTPISVDGVVDLVEILDVRSVSELLRLLPHTYRRRFALMHDSRSLQFASPENPRAILYGDDGTFLSTFSGDPTQRGFDEIEFVQYRGVTKTFETSAIGFLPHRAGRFYEDVNSNRCNGCHRGESAAGRPNDPKPIWGYYQFWPGAYRACFDTEGTNGLCSQDAHCGPPASAQSASLDQFFQNAPSHPRYRSLAEPEIFHDYGQFGAQPNGHLTLYTSILNAQRIGRRVYEHSKYDEIWPAVLALLFCPGEAHQFYPSAQCDHLTGVPTFDRADHEHLKSYLEGLEDDEGVGFHWPDWSTDFRQLSGLPPCTPINFDQTFAHLPGQIIARGLLDEDPALMSHWLQPAETVFQDSANNIPDHWGSTARLPHARPTPSSCAAGLSFCQCLKAAVTQTPNLGCPTPTPAP